jgi:flagellin-like protein
MIQKQTQKGVSPVIGVILMVAITVIIAAVVANFVLDLGGNLSEDADATVTFNQDANYADSTYDVTITTTAFDNADYTYVQVAGGLDTSKSASYNQQTNDKTFLDNNVAPEHKDVAMINSGDRIIIEDVGSTNGEIDVQVFGVLEGSENQIAGYSLSDDQRFFT